MPPRDPKIRLFIAARVPEPAQEVLQRAAEYLESAAPNQVRWVNPDTIHLTLKFLGDIEPSRTAGIMAAMENEGRQFDGGVFRIGLAGLGVFQRQGKIRVIWGGIQGEIARLEKLHDNLDAALEKAGFPPDRPPYRPHLTLGRARNYRSGLDPAALSGVLARWQPPSPVEWTVDGIHLVHSVLGQGPPRHVTLGSVTLTELGNG